jgi:hypothetical protein
MIAPIIEARGAVILTIKFLAARKETGTARRVPAVDARRAIKIVSMILSTVIFVVSLTS